MSTGPVRRGAALLSAGLVIALLPAGTSAAQDPPPDPARSPTTAVRTATAADAARTVTLVT
ncbi:hypothetical protein GTY88_20355, partial [Streptomyces sp. SID5926]|nr:hypothetical protein [Streptomyces sp. SID5926]